MGGREIREGEITEKEYLQLPAEEKKKVVVIASTRDGKLTRQYFYEPTYFDSKPLSELESRPKAALQITKFEERVNPNCFYWMTVIVNNNIEFALCERGQGFIHGPWNPNVYEVNYRRETAGCDFGLYKLPQKELVKILVEDYLTKLSPCSLKVEAKSKRSITMLKKTILERISKETFGV